MPLNKLDSIIKNTEGRILYVSPADLDSTDSISNQGNSLARPFKTLQRALIESARFSYIKGNSNDETEKTTILLMPGEHVIDNRPGHSIDSAGQTTPLGASFSLTLNSVFDLTQKDNDLFKFNSVNGGVIVPRGTSIVGLDLRKTKLRPLYVPNPTTTYEKDAASAIFRITGACYFWQFSIFDGDEFGTVYTDSDDFNIKSTPTFSHHKLTVFEYADGVNNVGTKGLTDLQMYYAKLSQAYSTGSGRPIDTDDVFPTSDLGFSPRRPEFEIVGAFAADPIKIESIFSGAPPTSGNVVTVTTRLAHGLNIGTPIRIKGVIGDNAYNISTKVSGIDNDNDKIFNYRITGDIRFLKSGPFESQGTVTIETDTVTGASPYIFNISMRSVWGMAGMHADGSKATGFRSMVVAQFTGVSLQKDDRAFVKYDPTSRIYKNNFYSQEVQEGSELSGNSSSTSEASAYHLDSEAVYRQGWEQTHIKMSNDAIVQIVSVFAIGYNQHFAAESGGDASVTNSNSNFGQLSLIANGFKKEAFEKDDKAFITHIIPPRTIDSTEEDIDWLTLDNSKTSDNTKLYLFGFNNEDVKPPILTQGYRVGAKVNDKLFLTVGGTEYSADILMSDGSSSFKEYPVTSGPTSNIFTIGTHGIVTGEKVIIISDDGDLPENLRTNTVYYAIVPNNTTIKLASSAAEAGAGEEITVYGGTKLKILTRVSDKQSGDSGHPVQWDGSQWYINVNSTGNTITGQLSGTGASEPTIIKRIADTRSLDEKIYKVRVVVPSQLLNGKTPESGFVIQESSSTGIRSDADASAVGITTSDYDFNRNPRFISTCSFSSSPNIVTVVAELPHNLQTGDSVIIKNVTDSTNTVGSATSGYNGTFDITIVDDLTFTYPTTKTNIGGFTNNVNDRTTTLPRFERNDLQENIYVYRNEVISEYNDNQNGVYHIYALNSNNSIPQEFTNLKYSQNVTDLYPQLDRDNPNDNPKSAKTFALRSPLGEVQTDDLKKSITRETTDKLLRKLGLGLDVDSVINPTSTSPTIQFAQNHGFAGIVTGSKNATLTSGFTPGTYYNVKISKPSNAGVAFDNAWNGATAKVVIAAGANIDSVEIMNGGSGYSPDTYFLDTRVIGAGTNNDFTVVESGISSVRGQVVQFTGVGTVSDTYHRITGVPTKNQISIARTTGDPVITSDHYTLVTAPSVSFTASGDVVTATGHGLAVGNKFRSINLSNENVGDYIVDSVGGVNTFTVTGGIGAASGYILKHGLSSNKGVSDKTNENLEVRGITLFDGEILTSTSGVGINSTQFPVSGEQGGVIERFPLGTYVQVDNEIMRISSNSLSGNLINEITVIRGALATKQESHPVNSIIKKIKIPAIEFHRPSIIRASGHTFEYLGYGPGNYSTALPQVQDRALTEREEFLSQAQERSSGLVVYTGMNSKGDFFIGNQKKSSATGEETNFDIPVPTVTGEDPSRLSVVFDEVTIKERLVVEGGSSNQVLSQFGGPVTFDEKVKVNALVKIANETDSALPTSGALIVTGGVGIGKSLSVGGNITGPGATSGNIQIAITEDNTIDTSTGKLILDSSSGEVEINDNLDLNGSLDVNSTSVFQEQATFRTGIVPETDEGAYIGTAALPFSEAHIGEIRIANGSVAANDNKIDTATGNLVLDSAAGNIVVADNIVVSDAHELTVGGSARFADDSVQIAANTVTANLFDGNLQGNADTATLATTVTTVNSTTDTNFRIPFHSEIGSAAANLLNDGGLRYNPSTNKLTVSGAGSFGGDITAFASDERLKTNISPITDALFKVNSLDGFTYNFNDIAEQLGFDTEVDYAGVSAQQVQKVLPEAVKPAPVDNNYITVQYEKLVPLLIEAIKELSDKVEKLEQKLSDK